MADDGVFGDAVAFVDVGDEYAGHVREHGRFDAHERQRAVCGVVNIPHRQILRVEAFVFMGIDGYEDNYQRQHQHHRQHFQHAQPVFPALHLGVFYAQFGGGQFLFRLLGVLRFRCVLFVLRGFALLLARPVSFLFSARFFRFLFLFRFI